LISRQQERGWGQNFPYFLLHLSCHLMVSFSITHIICGKLPRFGQMVGQMWQTAVEKWHFCLDIYSTLYFYLCIPVDAIYNGYKDKFHFPSAINITFQPLWDYVRKVIMQHNLSRSRLQIVLTFIQKRTDTIKTYCEVCGTIWFVKSHRKLI